MDYEAGLDPAGRAERASDFSITPEVVGADARRDAVSPVGLEVSCNDGVSWRWQSLRDKQGMWKASLNAPRAARDASVRGTAKQRDGGSIAQTVIRAFGLR
ncbi:hypothetical protein [Streptomyces parvulus]|uniref:hypothetical protein n=1 Tax=Streptomyces parvulus TaxID=146923 RepID=UPI0034171855